MSDSSNSTGSSGSSTNSWTLLSPEEVAIENVGPADDGTESLGDAPSLSEEVAGAAAEFKPADIPVETVLSEEGHQVCQETSPESSEGPVPSSPARMSPRPSTPLGPPDLDMESQPPVIHDIVASSPSDNEHLGGVSFVTNIDLSAPLHVPEVDLAEQLSLAPSTAESPVPPELDTPADSGDVTAEPDPPTETPSGVEAGRGETPEPKEPPPSDPEPPLTGQTDDGPATEPVWSGEEEEDEEPEEMPAQEEEEEDVESSSSFQDGLRRRNVASLDAGRARTSDEEEDEEEVEVKLPQREEKPWLSVNKCIVGALVLLFLGSLFLSGDFDASEQSDGEHVQDWIRPDPQDMKTLMNKLQQENQEIRQLETELQWKTEALDSEMRAAAASGDEKGRADLEAENVKLKAELSSLPELKAELEQLRARVTELSRLSAAPPAAPSSSQSDDVAGREPQTVQDAGAEGTLKDKLQQQQVLLMESKRRLEGMNRDGGGGKRLQDGLEEIRRKLSEHVENLGNMKLPDNNGRRSDRRGKDDKKEWKHSKEGGKKENRKEERKDRKEERKDRKEERKDRKDERKDRKEERKDRKDERKDRKDERKPPNENPHKESWRKHQDEWERKKDERREDREQRRREKPWHRRPEKSPHQPPRQHHGDFWKDQELKLHRNVRPRLDCRSPEDCAAREGLYPVELQEFEALLEGYLSKLEKSSAGSKNAIRRLTAEFFEDGVFIHDRALFGSFAEDVADVLEDMVDLFEAGRMHDDSLEEEMEEFEREAMWKFAATA